MTDDLRTGMARALCKAEGADPDRASYWMEGEPEWKQWLDSADAAISHYTAHLESKAMVERAFRAVCENVYITKP